MKNVPPPRCLLKRIKKIFYSFVSLLIIFLIVNTSFAQTVVQQEWIETFSGSDSIFNIATSVDINNNLYVTGAISTLTTGEDFVTLKYDKDGNLLWTKTYNGPGNSFDRSVAIAVDSLCNSYVTGQSAGIGFNIDYATIKYDSMGNEQWVRRFDGPVNGSDQPTDLVIDNNGNVFVTGSSDGGFPTALDFATIKYDNNGNQLWVQRFSGNATNSFDFSNAITTDGGGNVYVTGSAQMSGTGSDVITLKYDGNGVQQWVRYFDAQGLPDGGNDVIADGAGNVYVTGFISTNTTESEYITIKYDINGSLQWSTTFNGPGNGQDIARVVTLDSGNNVLITGTSFVGNSPILFIPQFDIATIKYDVNGIEQWVQLFSGPLAGFSEPTAIAIDATGNVYVTGGTTTDTILFVFGNDPFPACLSLFTCALQVISDYATVKYDASGIEQWVQLHGAVNKGIDIAFDMVIDNETNVYVTGFSFNGNIFDITTIKYSQTEPLTITAAVIDETCEAAGEGSIDLMVTGGILPYTFLWSNGATTEDIDSLTAGEYIVTVTDSVGNMAVHTAVINDPPPDPKDPPSCSDLYFSEYCEGSKQNKAIEIFNPSDSVVELNRYFIRIFMNGAPTPLIQQLMGKPGKWGLVSGETFIIANPNADSSILAVADQVANKLNFNGDDAIQLIKVLNEVIPNVDSIEGIGGNPHAIFDTLDLDILDLIGIPFVVPGNNGFPVGSGSTKNHTLIRKPGVTSGKEDWACGQKQWKVMPQDEFADLGNHENQCKTSSAKRPCVRWETLSSTVLESVGVHDIKVVVSNTSLIQLVIHHNDPNTCIESDPATVVLDYSVVELAGTGGFYIPTQSKLVNVRIIILQDLLIEGTETICLEIQQREDDYCLDLPCARHVVSIIDDDVISGIGDIDADEISIYPVITESEIFIEGFQQYEISNLSINSILGQHLIMKEVKANEHAIKIDVSSLAKGVYVVNLYKENGTIISKKFIKR